MNILFVRSIHITSLDSVDGHDSWPQLRYVASERNDGPYAHSTKARQDGVFVVQLCQAGVLIVDRADGSDRCHRGQALCFRTGIDDLHYRSDAGAVYASTYVETAGQAALAIGGGLIERFGHVIDGAADHAAWQNLAALVTREPTAHRLLPSTVHQRLFNDLMQALIAANARPLDQGQRLVAQAMDWMREHLAAPIDVTVVARQLGVGREHLSRAFSAVNGIGPAAWLRQERLRLAATMLRDPDRPVAAIAQACGFASPSHFIQRFRRHYGQTPERWRH